MTDLGRALLDQLEPEDLADLADRLAPFLRAPTDHHSGAMYSTATLAAELGRSERSVRAAISRGELQAVKRGRGYVISAEAVAEWTRPPATTLHGRANLAPSPSRRQRSGPGPVRRALQSSARSKAPPRR